MLGEERMYLALRLMMLVVGLGLFVTGLLPSTGVPQRNVALLALALMLVGTVVMLVGAFARSYRISQMMLWVLPVDLVSLAAYTWLLGPRDALVGVYALLVILYAMTAKRGVALLATIGLVCAYTTAHLVASTQTPLDLVEVGVSMVALLCIGLIVANAVGRQRQRDAQVEEILADRERMNEQLARRLGELQAVARITEIIHSSLDFDEVGELVLDTIAKVIDFPSLAIFVIDKETSETLFSSSVGMPRPEGVVDGATVDLDSVSGHLNCQRAFDHGSLMVLFCANGEDMERLTEEDRLVIYALASELVVAVENSRLYKLTRRLAVTDELTGIANYRYLQQRIDEEMSRAKRFGKDLSLLMIDTDDFKGFNDAYGHLAGDRALSEFGGVLGRAVRDIDVIARYGGEEFAVVLPETDAAGAFVAAEKIREAFSEHLFPDDTGARTCTLTVSIGMATYPTNAESKDALLRESDDALYRAKNSGKNRVCAPGQSPEPFISPRRR